MKPIGDRIEQQVQEAMAKGEFENLPGAGKPLDLEDDSFIPDDMKVAFRVLKNAGVTPPEVTMYQELQEIRVKLAEDASLSESERESLQKKLIQKESQFNMALERMQKRS